MALQEIQREMLSLKKIERAELLGRFFKTGKGEYAEGDEFYGISVPVTRSIAKKFCDLELGELGELIKSKIHEERLCALLILVERYKNKKTTESEKEEIKDFYLSNTKYINNWDLVDLSAHYILGEWLWKHPQERGVLEKMAKSGHLWERRIAIISTFYFIREKEFEESLKIAELLLNDKHDLIHKAAGWMLREVGKKDLGVEEGFLLAHYKKMPRTMLRYAIEKFPEKKRQAYLKGTA